MDTQIIAIFCLCDDMLKGLHHFEDPQRQMSDAEAMTTAIVAMLYFKGNFSLASRFLLEAGYIPGMLSRSRFNRRLHAIAELFLSLFLRLGQTWTKLNENSLYVVDSFPIAVCDNYRIMRSKIYKRDEAFRGYIPSKKRYFYGVRIHILVTEHGEPVEFFLAPGSIHDATALGMYHFNLPDHSLVIGDKAYNDYTKEDLMNEAGVCLAPIRKVNSKRPFPAYISYFIASVRKVVETTGSLISQMLPKHIHAVTARGFELKVGIFVLASSINFLW